MNTEKALVLITKGYTSMATNTKGSLPEYMSGGVLPFGFHTTHFTQGFLPLEKAKDEANILNRLHNPDYAYEVFVPFKAEAELLLQVATLRAEVESLKYAIDAREDFVDSLIDEKEAAEYAASELHVCLQNIQNLITCYK